MSNIQLTQELVKSLFDYKDGFLYWKIRPYKSCVNINHPAGCIANLTTGARRTITIKCKNYLNSRLIFLYHNGYMPLEVDHENNNKLDDRIENLRESDRFTNSRNRTSAKGSSSKYLGVSCNRNKYWYANLMHNGISVYIGSFKNETLAALAYNKEAVKYHKEFANLNIIQP